MSGRQCSHSYASSTSNSTALQFQTANPYAALVATAGPEHDGRSSSSGSPPSSGSAASLFSAIEGAAFAATPSRSQAQTYNSSRTAQRHYYGSPEHVRAFGFGATNTPTRTGYAARTANHEGRRNAGHASMSSAASVPPAAHNYHAPQASSLADVPESVAVQETAFRLGQHDSSSALEVVPASHSRSSSTGFGPRSTSLNFAWTVLINPYTQSLKNPNGSLDPAWTRKMIAIALDCMHELIRITCRRNTGWEKTVADIPLPAQEALAAFPDLAQEYEQLKRDAQEARAGGRPYGY